MHWTLVSLIKHLYRLILLIYMYFYVFVATDSCFRRGAVGAIRRREVESHWIN